jgi:hypothetical protein
MTTTTKQALTSSGYTALGTGHTDYIVQVVSDEPISLYVGVSAPGRSGDIYMIIQGGQNLLSTIRLDKLLPTETVYARALRDDADVCVIALGETAPGET